MRLEAAAPLRGPSSLRRPARQAPVPSALPSLSLTEVQILAARTGVYILCFFDNAQHTFGTLMYAAVLGLALLCLARDSVVLLRVFLPLWIVATLYILLSLAHVLPPAWTVFYRISAIPSQINWVVALPLIASLASSYASHVLRFHCLREFKIVSVLLVFNFVASGFLSSDHYSAFSYGPFGYLWAPMSIYLMIVSWGVMVQNNTRILTLFLMQAAPVIVLAEGSQTKIAYLVVAGTLVMRRVHSSISAMALISVIAFVIGGYAYTLNNVYEVYQGSPDVGIRALMVKNAFYAVLDTYFVGVGYGTESLLNVYPEVDVYSFSWLNDAFVLIGVHNSFADVMMKMGILGLVALVYTILQLAMPFGDGSPRDLGFRRIMLAIVLLNMSVNVGLQSPFHMAGIGVMLGAAFAARSSLSRSRSM